MHRALQISEVVYTISSCAHQGSLPALASTCRAFEGPALDALWRDLQSVEPLIGCLPSDLFSSGQDPMELQKPLDAKMWDTLRKYTSRVHSITQSVDSSFIEPLGSIMLSCPSSPPSLFPRLRKLEWRAYGSQYAAEFLRMAFVPSLLSLDIEIYSPSSTFLSVISSLSALCPHLRDMTLDTYEASEVFHKGSPFILQSISGLQNLRTLSIWDPGNEGIGHIMQLQALRSLSLYLGEGPSIRDSQSQLPGFHDLEFFHLSADNLEDALDFLNSLRAIRSEEISASFDVAPISKTILTKFLAILQQKCDNDNLQYFTLKFLSGSVRTRPDDFMPLQACRNLIQLHIMHGCDTSISDEELCQMVSAWPELEGLSIGGLSIGNAMITFHGLINLLRLRPTLTSLCLAIDATKLDGIDIKCPGGGFSSKLLKSLVLGNSPIDSPQNVALILSGLLPYLQRVEFAHWDLYPTAQTKKMINRWKSVTKLLHCFRAIIVRERYHRKSRGEYVRK